MVGSVWALASVADRGSESRNRQTSGGTTHVVANSLARVNVSSRDGAGGVSGWLMDGPPAQSDSALLRPFVNRRFNIYLQPRARRAGLSDALGLWTGAVWCRFN